MYVNIIKIGSYGEITLLCQKNVNYIVNLIKENKDSIKYHLRILYKIAINGINRLKPTEPVEDEEVGEKCMVEGGWGRCVRTCKNWELNFKMLREL